MKKTGGGGGKGHTSKHAGTRKHHARGAKHHPRHEHLTAEGRQDLREAGAHTKGKHPHHARGLAVGDLLPVCSLEAVAQSLRLAGQPVGDDEVAWLWELSGSRELSIAEALAAAVRFGLAGMRPPVVADGLPTGVTPRATPPIGRTRTSLPSSQEGVLPTSFLILGVDVPGPHAVLATPDGWWSWGQLWTPWTTAVSEAWAVSWS